MIRDTDRIEKRIVELESQMDSVMQLSRSVIRLAGKAITALHSKRKREATGLIERMSEQVKELTLREKGFEHYALQAHQEYSEAMIVYGIMERGKVPTIGELGEGEIPYLLGMMDVVGELKREAFESMRTGSLKEASRYYDLMLDIYDSTAHFRFASALVPDFRKKQDTARIQIEGTIGELVSLENRGRGRR